MRKVVLTAFCFVSLCTISSGQNYFNHTYHFDEDAAHFAREIEPLNDGFAIMAAEVCEIPYDQGCVRFLRYVVQSDTCFWEQNFQYVPPPGYSRGEAGNFVRSSFFDGYYCLGTSNGDGAFWKLDDDFNFSFQKAYDFYLRDYYDSLLEDLKGDVMLVGSRETNLNSNGDENGFLHKVDSEGNTIWYQEYQVEHRLILSSVIKANAFNSNAGYIASGKINGFIHDLSDGYIMKVDADGNLIWGKKIEGLPLVGPVESITTNAYSQFWGTEGTLRIIEHPFGGFVGYQNLINYFPDLPMRIPRVIRFDADGEIVWETQLLEESGSAFVNGLAIAPDGDIVGCGSSLALPNINTHDGWLFRLDRETGDELWRRAYEPRHFFEGGSQTGQLNDIIFTEEGNILAVGSALSTPMQFNDLWVLHLDENGCIESNCDEINLFVGIEDIDEVNQFFSVPNNPVSGNEIAIELKPTYHLGSGTISVYSINGKLLSSSPIDEGASSLAIQVDGVRAETVLLVLTLDNRIAQVERVLLMR